MKMSLAVSDVAVSASQPSLSKSNLQWSLNLAACRLYMDVMIEVKEKTTQLIITKMEQHYY